ncbi:MAG: hypothetical protein ACM32E_11380 [Gemmatimonadota bacterium]
MTAGNPGRDRRTPGTGVLDPAAPPAPGRMRDIYARHASRLLP